MSYDNKEVADRAMYDARKAKQLLHAVQSTKVMGRQSTKVMGQLHLPHRTSVVPFPLTPKSPPTGPAHHRQ